MPLLVASLQLVHAGVSLQQRVSAIRVCWGCAALSMNCLYLRLLQSAAIVLVLCLPCSRRACAHFCRSALCCQPCDQFCDLACAPDIQLVLSHHLALVHITCMWKCSLFCLFWVGLHTYAGAVPCGWPGAPLDAAMICANLFHANGCNATKTCVMQCIA